MLITKNAILNFQRKISMIKTSGLNMWLSEGMFMCKPRSTKQNENKK